jgi:hypothetical protein
MSSPIARHMTSSATAPPPAAAQPQFHPETAVMRLVDAAGKEDGKQMIMSTEQDIRQWFYFLIALLISFDDISDVLMQLDAGDADIAAFTGAIISPPPTSSSSSPPEVTIVTTIMIHIPFYVTFPIRQVEEAAAAATIRPVTL